MFKHISSSASIPIPTEKSEFPIELNELIRHRAYELYELRGKEDGHDLEDWKQAESEMLARSASKIEAA